MTSRITGVAITASTVASVPWPEAWSLPLPGPISGPMTQITIGSAITVARSHRSVKRRAWLGSLIRLLCHVDEAAHVAQRLHRAAVAEVVAGAARHEALPAIASLLARAEAEGDRAVSARRGFARRFFAWVLGFFGHSRERHEHAHFGHRERVRGFFGVDRVDGLAVEGHRPVDSPLDLREERVAQAGGRVVLIERHVDDRVGGHRVGGAVYPTPVAADQVGDPVG